MRWHKICHRSTQICIFIECLNHFALLKIIVPHVSFILYTIYYFLHRQVRRLNQSAALPQLEFIIEALRLRYQYRRQRHTTSRHRDWHLVSNIYRRWRRHVGLEPTIETWIGYIFVWPVRRLLLPRLTRGRLIVFTKINWDVLKLVLVNPGHLVTVEFGCEKFCV